MWRTHVQYVPAKLVSSAVLQQLGHIESTFYFNHKERKLKIYVPAVSLKLLEPCYQCTLHSIGGAVLAHITTVHQMLNWLSLYEASAL